EKQALRESEDKYRAIVENTQDAIYIYRDNRLIYVNKRLTDLLGYTRDELLGTPFIEVFHPDDRARISEYALLRVQGEAVPEVYEARVITKSGDTKIFSFKPSAITLSGEYAVLGAATDITSRKEYEHALIESEKKYRSVIENIRDVYYRTDAQGNLAMTNPSGARMFGYDSPEEMTGLPLDMFWDKIDTRKKILETMRETGAANDVEAEFTRKDGTRFSVSVSAHLVFDEYGTFLGTEGIIRDITERKLAAEKLRRNEERMRRILESTNDGYYEWNIVTGEVFINDRYLELMGFARGELAESFEEWKQHVHPDDIDTVMEQLSSAIGGAAESYSAEYRLQSKSGGWIWISDNGRVVERDDAGSPVRFAGVHHDINEQKKAEEALRASEEKYRKIFNNVQDVFYQTDMNGIITEISPSIERHSGYTREELIGKPVNMVYDNREDREEFVSTIIGEGEVFDYELHLRSKSGRMVYTSANAHLLIDEKGNPAGIEGSLRDISERKEVEEALRES
ncbi:MAG TPA: PAS domain S-box protein, partial [Spirochaetota bacterium]|nr:PAS domain S-box protein [Spirochaetota bacterium]